MTRLRLLSLIVLVAAGCTNSDPTKGWTIASQYRPGIRTVAVPIWTRGAKEFRRDIEIRLTEAVCKTIEAETPYKIVQDRGRADTLLTGTLRQVRQHVLSFEPRTGTAREIQMTMVVDFTWSDLRTGEVLAEAKAMKVSAEYIPLAPFSEDFFQGSEDALNRVALRVVEQMHNPW